MHEYQVAGSDAPISKDLRSKVYLDNARRYDRDIDYLMRERYGDFVLYDPPLDGAAMIIWLVPAGLVFMAISILGWLSTEFERRKEW